MKFCRFSALCLLLVLVAFSLCACTDVVNNSADELRLNSWSAQLDNGSVILLSFSEDYATFKLANSEEETCVIDGLCEISDTAFVIHDKSTSTSFAFSYIVHFDSVEIYYEGNSVSLYKS